MSNTGLKILVGTPLYAGLEPKATAPMMNALLATQRTYPDAQIDVITTNRIYIWAAREEVKNKFLKEGYTYLFFVDEDTVLESNTLVSLLAHKQLMISALCFIRYQPYFAMYGNFDKKHNFICNRELIPDKPFYQDATGLGCCLLHKSCFDGAPNPIFLPKENYLSEDLAFFSVQNKRGLRVLIDPVIQVGHISQEKPIITKYNFNRNFHSLKREK